MNRALVALDPSRVELYETRESWEAGRKAGEHRIGASTVGRIMADPWGALQELTGQAPEPDEATREAWACGHFYEPGVVQHYAYKTGRPAYPIGEALGAPAGTLVIVRHRSEAWCVASPDAGTIDPELGAGFVEAKDYVGGEWAREDVELWSADDYGPGVVPKHIIYQCYWQMLASDVEFVDIARRGNNRILRVIRVRRDAAAMDVLLQTIGEWRERHLVRGEPLPVDGSESCKDALTRRYPGVGKATRPATPEEAALVLEYVKAAADEKAAKAKKDAARNAIAQALGDTYGVTVGTGKFLLIPMPGKRTVALSDVEAKAPDLFRQLVEGGFLNVGDAFRKASPYGL